MSKLMPVEVYDDEPMYPKDEEISFFEMGVEANYDGKRRSDNPFGREGFASQEWEQGWNTAHMEQIAYTIYDVCAPEQEPWFMDAHHDEREYR